MALELATCDDFGLLRGGWVRGRKVQVAVELEELLILLVNPVIDRVERERESVCVCVCACVCVCVCVCACV